MLNRYNNLNGGSRVRLAAMRRYAADWPTKHPHAPTREISWREARSHGVGSIRADAHGPTFGDYPGANIPASVLDGLRDAGTAEDLADLRHSGWYADADQDELYCGRVWQLPARNGEPLYIAGYVERGSGYAMLCAHNGRLETFDDSRGAAIAADRLAERNAEREREYNERWQEATRLDEKETEASEKLRADRLAYRVIRGAHWHAPTDQTRKALENARKAFARSAKSVRKVRAELEPFADVDR